MGQNVVRVRVVDSKGEVFNFKGHSEIPGFAFMGEKQISEAKSWIISNMYNWMEKRGRAQKTNQWKLEKEVWSVFGKTSKVRQYYISKGRLGEHKLISANDAYTFSKMYDKSAGSRSSFVEEYFLYLAYLAAKGWINFEEMVDTAAQKKNMCYVLVGDKMYVVGGRTLVTLEEIPNPDFPADIMPMVTIPADD